MRRAPALASALFLCLLAAPVQGRVLDAPSTTYANLQAALTAAQSGDVVRVKRRASAYTELLTLKDGVVLEGEETAGTILSGAITWRDGATLRRVTVTSPFTLSSVHRGTIENCIFRNVSGTALAFTNVRRGDAPTGSLLVRHNTFFANTTGLSAANTDDVATVALNLFSANSQALNLDVAAAPGPTMADNYYRLSTGDPNPSGVVGGDAPLFLDEGNDPDLHLTTSSPGRDRGAYSGAEADRTPSPPEGVAATSQGDGHTFLVTWNPNRAYNVTVESYGLYMGRSAGAEGDRLETVAAGTSYARTLDLRPATPTGVAASPRDGAVHITWTEDARADGYLVGVSATRGGAEAAAVDVGNASAYTKTGLANGTGYYVTVKAYATGARYLSVKASASDGQTKWESRPAEVSAGTLARQESAFSAEVSATPAPVVGFPPLDDNGACFVDSLAGRRLVPGAGRVLALLAAAALGFFGARRRARTLAAAALAGVLLLAPALSEGREPRWVASLAGGAFEPDQEGWDDAYDHSWVPQGRVGLGFRLLRQLELGADAGYWRAEGSVRKTSDGQVLDPPLDQTLTVVPLQAYVLVNLHFWEGQWVVPYAAGGYSYVLYRHRVQDGGTVKGHATGTHGRAGLKLALNPLEPEAARQARDRSGLRRSYLFLEAHALWADPSGDADLTGLGYLAGLSLEF